MKMIESYIAQLGIDDPCAQCPHAVWQAIEEYGDDIDFSKYPAKNNEIVIDNKGKAVLACFCTITHNYIQKRRYICNNCEAEELPDVGNHIDAVKQRTV